MAYCKCNCGQKLAGRALRFATDECRERYWSEARVRGAAFPPGKDLAEPLPPKGRGHFCDVIGNPRLEPLMLALHRQGVMTSQELQAITGSMCIATDISNIRAKGYPVSKGKLSRVTDTGRKVYEYRWEGAPA